MKLKIFFALLLTTGIFLAGFYYGKFGAHRTLRTAQFERLPGWQQNDLRPALQSFQHSCLAILKRQSESAFSQHLIQSKKVSDWQRICSAAMQLNEPDLITAQQFFEHWFQPYQVGNNFNSKGLFTGYYLPLLHASLVQTEQYHVPIYGLPKDLIRINLGKFYSESHKSIVARLEGNVLQPYPDRAAINHGTIKQNADVLLWADNVLDVFFAQIQGSAIAELPDKSRVLLGYAGTNGHPYTAIGKILAEKNAVKKHALSMQTIRAWLEAHPEQMDEILNHNASYVFFKIMTGDAAIGTAGVPLTPNHSLAVDTKYIPLGAPLWLDTSMPDKAPFRQLVIAQDTGGAIKGIVRGDLFWGAGENAAANAGRMQSAGRYWILLPRESRENS